MQKVTYKYAHCVKKLSLNIDFVQHVCTYMVTFRSYLKEPGLHPFGCSTKSWTAEQPNEDRNVMKTAELI